MNLNDVVTEIYSERGNCLCWKEKKSWKYCVQGSINRFDICNILRVSYKGIIVNINHSNYKKTKKALRDLILKDYRKFEDEINKNPNKGAEIADYYLNDFIKIKEV